MAYTVLRLATDAVIDLNEARIAIDAMAEAGWYCTPDGYARIVQTLAPLED